jgi:hypothetical protein
VRHPDSTSTFDQHRGSDRGPSRRRWWHALLVVACLSSVGVSHSILDIAEALIDGHMHAICPSDEAGSDCPPGCPDCHFQHASSAPMPVVRFAQLVSPPMAHATTRSLSVTVDGGPRQPCLASLFRPPRLRSIA